MAGRKYCRNTVAGTRRGKKYPPKVRAEVVMAMLGSNSICAVARKYGVPESTIRSWLAEEAARSDAFAKERQAAALEIAIRASLGTRAQVAYLQSRADENQRAAQIRGKLNRRLDPEEEKILREQLDRYEAQAMSDKDAANIAKVLMLVAEKAAALVPGQEDTGEDGSPMIEIGRAENDSVETEVLLDD